MSRLSQKRIDAVLARQEPAIRKAFLDAIAAHKGAINMAALAAALERGDIAGAVTLAQISPAILYPLDAAVTATFIEGGNMVSASAPKYAVQFGFDGRATRAERWARDNAAGLVQDITGEQAESIRTLVGDRLGAGANAQKLAREVRSVVGLRPDQVRTVNNVRADLDNLSAEYFTRKLRDKRFDPLVRRAIAEGKPLSQADIDRIVQRYAERSLAHRAEVIARTESLNALRAGRDEGVRQAIEQGAIGDAKKAWDSSADSRVRPDHRFMDGQTVGLNEPFIAPDGSRLMYPGDSSLGASAAQTVLCRCFTDYVVNWISAAERQDARRTARAVSPATSAAALPQPPTRQSSRADVARAAATRLRQRGASTGHEHFEIIDSDGNVIAASTSGHARKIEISEADRLIMGRRGANLSFHHNHPAPVASFSPADIDAFSKSAGLAEIYAHAEQASFRAVRLSKTSRITPKVLREAQKEAQALMARALNSGANISTLLSLEPHAMMLVLQKRGFLKYEFELPPSALNVARILNDNL